MTLVIKVVFDPPNLVNFARRAGSLDKSKLFLTNLKFFYLYKTIYFYPMFIGRKSVASEY